MASYEELEDMALSSVLCVQLEGAPPRDPAVPLIKLSTLVEELAAEGAAHPVLLARANLERVLVDRLMTSFPDDYPQPPFGYLLGCYERATAVAMSPPATEPEGAEKIAATMAELQGLIVSYAGLTLIMGLVQQPPEAEKHGALQLLHSLAADLSVVGNGISIPEGTVRMPHGFLEAFAERYGDEGLDEVLLKVVQELGRQVGGMSIMGDFMHPLQVLMRLCSCKPVARVLATLPIFAPRVASGRSAQDTTLLGPFFALGAIPDDAMLFTVPQPDVRGAVFANFDQLRPGDISSSVATIRQLTGSASQGLFACVKALLGKDTRKATLSWVSNVLRANAERSKMQVNYNIASSHNFFLNLGLVLLELCGPFMDPCTGKAFQHVDVNFIGNNDGRIDWGEATKVGANAEEDAAHRKALAEAAPSPSYHFICECFFYTAHTLHLGLVKCVGEWESLQRPLREYTNMLSAMESNAMGPGSRQADRLRRAVNDLQARRLCFEAVLLDDHLLESALAFYRLVAAWVLRLASPDYAATGTPTIPLPEPCPPEFATLPSSLFEDMAETILFVARLAPQVLQRANLSEIMLAITVLMGSASYLKSPWLRCKLVEVIYACLPAQQGRVGGRTGASSDMLELILQTDPLVLEHMVPNLIKLYVDIEYTSRDTGFYDKFNMRSYIGDILEHLWRSPSHKESWQRVALRDGGRGLYLQFTNMLVNDSIYLLDEAMKKLEEMRTLERRVEPATLASMNEAQQREEQEVVSNELRQTGDHLASLLHMALRVIRLVTTSSSETTTAAPFLLPEMVERISSMLNYFLLYITGPERKKLNIKDKDKYNFRPRELLSDIMTIYLNLHKADEDGSFAAAIAMDGRSYRAEMFPEAMHILSSQGLMSMEDLDLVQALAAQVTDAGDRAEEDEDALGEVPDDFLDPITYTLMRDPVIMPTSNTAIDRPVITRHLLTDPRDPINRMALTVEDLKPATELKAKITAWIAEQRAAAKAAKAPRTGDAMEE